MSTKFTSLEQHASYGIGLQMGQQLADNPFDGLDILAVAAGLAAAFQGDEPEVSEQQIGAAFQVISQRMQEQQEEHFRFQRVAAVEYPGDHRTEADLHQRQRQREWQDANQVAAGDNGHQHRQDDFNGMHASSRKRRGW